MNDTLSKRELWEKGRSDAWPVIDMHGHMGPWPGIWFPRASAESMVHTMDQAGVRMLCFCHHAALLSPDIGNAANVEAVRKFPDRLRAYFGINPHYPEMIARDLAGWDDHRDVYVGIKLLSGYHGVAMDAPAYEAAWRFADEHKLLALCHTWGNTQFNSRSHVSHVAQRYPNVRILMGHSLYGCWDDAIAVGREFPHVYLELTSVLRNRGVLESFVEAGLSGQILFGTDLPWFDPHADIGAVLGADITDGDRHNILHRNAERLLASVGVELKPLA